MCGITSLYINLKNISKVNRKSIVSNGKNQVIQASRKLRHRGPDWTGLYETVNTDSALFMGHERLEIVDPVGGAQPLVHKIGEHEISLCVNGEIYNHLSIRDLHKDFPFKTNSDCEVIIPLYLSFREEICQATQKTIGVLMTRMIDMLDGMFSFVLYDSEFDIMLVARDPVGITSLYYGSSQRNNNENQVFTSYSQFWIASEMKALDMCDNVLQFPAGHYMCSKFGFVPKDYFTLSQKGSWMLSNSHLDCRRLQHNYQYEYQSCNDFSSVAVQERCIRTFFTEAVRKRLMTDVPFGILLSGGLDSSLVASIAVKLVKDGMKLPWGDNIHTFSIGLEGSPDIAYAQKVADFLGTTHHTFLMTVEEGLNAIDDVIKHLETYDVTTIRAGTPMYLLSRKIKAMGVKMVLSGEGSDELYGGYLYFHKAPNDNAFHSECVSRMRNLQYSDCQRANKSTMAWGVEGRFPFLDKDFMDYSMQISPELKCKTITEELEGGGVKTKKIEKWILRNAFNVKEDGIPVYLPDEILWRQKEQFSDGVGYSWIDKLIETAENNDANLNDATARYLVNPPQTKEALLYRDKYEAIFPNRSTAVKLWSPRTDWSGVGADPSGRAQSVHNVAL